VLPFGIQAVLILLVLYAARPARLSSLLSGAWHAAFHSWWRWRTWRMTFWTPLTAPRDSTCSSSQRSRCWHCRPPGSSSQAASCSRCSMVRPVRLRRRRGGCL